MIDTFLYFEDVTFFLSSLSPHGIIQTSSAKFLFKISKQIMKCAYVGGSNEPPIIAILYFYVEF